ncbi:MAG TPA: hypothetical protein VFZ96_10155 [Actinomycetota bacterium]|nr:hypothetical protein [Actinomycetota bacterium]
MRKSLALLVAGGVLFAAVPAQAQTTKVNAAVNAVAWDDEGVDADGVLAVCSVFVNDRGEDPYVSLLCRGDEGYGLAWVKVKVPGVKGKVTSVRVAHTGDCTDLSIDWRKRRTNVLVTVSITAENACVLRTVRVRSTG